MTQPLSAQDCSQWAPQERPVGTPRYGVKHPPRHDDAPDDLNGTVAENSVNVGTGNCGGSGACVGCENGKAIILTAGHVYSGQKRYGVKFPDGRRFKATLLARAKNDRLDIGVLQIDNAPSDLPTARIRATDAQPGEKVWKCGFPAATQGHMDVRCGPVKGKDYFGDMVVDILMRSGDSGCGVYDEKGQLVGIEWGSKDRPGVGVVTPCCKILDFLRRHRIRVPHEPQDPGEPPDNAPPPRHEPDPKPEPLPKPEPAQPPAWAQQIQISVNNANEGIGGLKSILVNHEARLKALEQKPAVPAVNPSKWEWQPK